MKKFGFSLKLFIRFFIITGLVSILNGCGMPVDNTGGTNPFSGGGSSSSSPSGGGSTFGLYTETVTVSVIWDTDTKMYVWHDYGANAALSDDTSTHGDGTKSLKIICTSVNDPAGNPKPWFGVGFSVYPDTANRNLSAYNYLNFMYKGTKNFKVGMKDGLGNEHWFTAAQLALYGLVLDNAWHEIKVPFTAMSDLDFVHINQYFMICADGSMGCLINDIHWVDNIYYSAN